MRETYLSAADPPCPEASEGNKTARETHDQPRPGHREGNVVSRELLGICWMDIIYWRKDGDDHDVMSICLSCDSLLHLVALRADGGC